jgi:hypothetical protein
MLFQQSPAYPSELSGGQFRRLHQMTMKVVMGEHTDVGYAARGMIITRPLVPIDFVRIAIVMMLIAQNMIIMLHVIAAHDKVGSTNQSIRMGWKGLSETPSNRKKSLEGFSVGLFVR